VISRSESDDLLFTNTLPEWVLLNLKWYILVIPFREVLMVFSSKNTVVVVAFFLNQCHVFLSLFDRLQVSMNDYYVLLFMFMYHRFLSFGSSPTSL